MEKEKNNTLLVYKGQREGKKHDYIIVSTNCEKAKKGERLMFDKKVLNVQIGNGIFCQTEDGERFGRFDYADKEANELIKKEFTEKITEWSIDYRVFLEKEKREKAGVKKPSSHIDALIQEIVRASKHMRATDKNILVNYLTNQILK
tara:strand:- start:4207 stop:4647 length:441 start_codon:yes stop_codon:yes gene_type:complete